jgi:hypothetical protein
MLRVSHVGAVKNCSNILPLEMLFISQQECMNVFVALAWNVLIQTKTGKIHYLLQMSMKCCAKFSE